MSKQTVTYCPLCEDGWSDEDFLFGRCSDGCWLETRLETDEEEQRRLEAWAKIKARAEGLNW